jgi:hypothetical protein
MVGLGCRGLRGVALRFGFGLATVPLSVVSVVVDEDEVVVVVDVLV